MSADITVDVVIDNCNYGSFLGDAIESVLRQPHPSVRAIVVDDGSTDESHDVVRSFGDRIVPVLKRNGGQASALNAGFAHCTGDVVIFLDADDALAPGVAGTVASRFARDPSLASLQYRMEVIDEDGRRTGILKPVEHLPDLRGDVRRSAARFPFDLTWTAMSGNAFATRFLHRIMPVPEAEFRLGADWYLIHLARLLGTIDSLEDVGGYYRVHGGNRYETGASSIDLDHVRQTIGYAERARPHVEALARELGLLSEAESAFSVSALANRLVSLRLERSEHPIARDTRRDLLRAGLRAAARRCDVAWPMRVLFSGWFLATATAPRRLVRTLADLFLVPDRRSRINPILGTLHRRARTGALERPVGVAR